MENDRQSEKKNESDDSMGGNDTLYLSANENQLGGEITIRLDQDRKRKITIISECEPSEKKQTDMKTRSRSVDLRRQAIVNNALLSQQTSSSCSRSRSRSRSASRSRSRTRLPRVRSLSRTRSTSGNKLLQQRRTRSVSRSRNRNSSAAIPIRNERSRDVSKSDFQRFFRLPTHLSARSVLGSKAKNPPDFLKLPSPLFILTEQQAIGISEKKTVQFVTEILLTSKKLSLEDRKKLYSEMIEAEYVGTSRSSTDLRSGKDEEPEEEYQCKIYYSDKGVYIHTEQNVRKIRNIKSSSITEQKNYSNICKTKIIGEKGKSAGGWLNVSCSETVSVVNQLYTRAETFKIGLKDCNVEGKITIGSTKCTFDPTKTIQFTEDILFDNKNIGVLVNHKTSAEMKELWNHEHGSFGEEQSEYRELKFFFEGDDSKTNSTSSSQSSSNHAIEKEEGVTTARTPERPSQSDNSDSSEKSMPSRKSRSRSKRHKLRSRSLAKSIRTDNSVQRDKTPDKKVSRLPQLGSSTAKKVDCTMNETLFHSFPQATSTPKSPADRNNNSSFSVFSVAKPVTPESEKKRRAALSVREHRLSSSGAVEQHEIDVDKSLGSRKSPARNLSAMIIEQKPEDVRKIEGSSIISKATSPGTVYMYNTESSNSSSMNATAELHKDRLSGMSPKPRSTATPSPNGTLRVKKTRVIREVRQEQGKPAEISEKKEETVKEEKVKLSRRSASPATPTMKRSIQHTLDNKIITLSAVKTESVSMTPIRVSAISEIGHSSSASETKSFPEQIQVELLVDGKHLVFNLNMDILSTKQPEIEIVGFSFRGQKLWEKSSEWTITSANTTSQTKTIARQASNIETDDKNEGEKK